MQGYLAHVTALFYYKNNIEWGSSVVYIGIWIECENTRPQETSISPFLYHP